MINHFLLKVDENSAETIVKPGNTLIVFLKVVGIPKETLEKEEKIIKDKEEAKNIKFPANEKKKVYIENDIKAQKVRFAFFFSFFLENFENLN